MPRSRVAPGAPRLADRLARVAAWRVALIALALAPVARAAPDSSAKVRTAPRPAWVDPLPVPPSPPGGRRGGVDYLLIEDQVRLGAAGAEHWARRVRQITGLAGLDAESQIQVDWAPSHESLTLHRVAIWRDGRELDRLDASSIEVLRREPGIEAALIDGALSALIVIEDVRVGDILEHEFTVAGSNPVFGDRWFGHFNLTWDLPVRRSGFRMLWPESEPLSWRHPPDMPPRLASTAGQREARWVLDDVAARISEGDEPSWASRPELALSQYESWDDVLDWAQPLYAAGEARGEVANLAARLAQQGDTLEDRALAALRFVQDEIRYLGIELGTGSHRPAAPATVLARRFGDCKDKTVLLVTLLRALGIEAHAALVSSDLRQEVTGELPSPGAFNHVIVRARLDGRTIWLDPTISGQGGRLNARHVPRYGVALAVDEGPATLVAIEPSPGDAPRVDVDVRFVLQEPGGDATMVVRTTARGRDADLIRATLEGSSLEAAGRDYLAFYRRAYPGLVPLRPLVVRDDDAANVLMIEEAYGTAELWQDDDDGLVAEFRVPEIESLLEEPATVERERPLALNYPQHVLVRLVIELPEEWPVAPVDEELEGPGARFRRRIDARGSRIEINWEWQTLLDALPPGEAPRHVDLLREAYARTAFRLVADPAGEPKPQEPAARPPDGARAAGGVAALAEGTPNWSVLALIAMSVLAGAVATVSLCAFRSARPEPAADAPPPAPPMLAAAAAFALIGLGATLRSLALPLDNVAWSQLTLPGSPAYHALAAPVLLSLLVAAVLLLTLAAALLPLWLLRRRSFPFVLAVVAIGWTDLELARAGLARLMPAVVPAAWPWPAIAFLGVAAATSLLLLTTRRAREAFVT